MAQNKYKNSSFDDFHTILGKYLSRMRDVSLRDGQQSWDANRWKNDHILCVLKAYDHFAKTIYDYTGFKVPEAELSGGGEYLQPARFLGEDPFDNLKSRSSVAQNVGIMSLYRGRQAFGFLPVSDEIQYYAILQSAMLGNNILRSFDMMNDIENIKVSFDAFLKVREKQIASGCTRESALKYEFAICYMSAPAKGNAAYSHHDYADLITLFLQYAKEQALNVFPEDDLSTFLSVVCKDYGGQVTKTDQVCNLATICLETMHNAGFKNIAFNLHSHGQKPDILQTALECGFQIVDTAIGDLSGGPSHTNLRDILHVLMAGKGYNLNDYIDHPIFNALKSVEDRIAEIAKIHIPYRMPLEVISAQDISTHKIASGAASALWSLISNRWLTQLKDQINPEHLTGEDYHDMANFFIETLKNIYDPIHNSGIWYDAGQFNTVTPGSTIAYNQALLCTVAKYSGRRLALGQHYQAYKDLVMGRYGKNFGLDKGLGDTQQREIYLLENAVECLKNVTSSEDYALLLKRVQLDGLLNHTDRFHPQRYEIFAKVALEDFREVILSSHLGDDIKDKIIQQSYSHIFPKPEMTLRDGYKHLEELEAEGITFCKDSQSYGLSAYDQAALLIILMTTSDKGATIGKNVLRYKHDPKKERIGDIESERFGDIITLIGRNIPHIIEDMAKMETLENILLKDALLTDDKKEKTKKGIQVINKRFRDALRQMLSDLKENGYISSEDHHIYSLKRAKEAIRTFTIMKKNTLVQEISRTPPSFWQPAKEQWAEPEAQRKTS
ncbi:MAG: hypothetical protein AAF621_00220 [Pseudomonadota bacterium]